MHALRRAAWARDGGRCVVTGAELPGGEDGGWELHHRRPGGMGGTKRPDQDTLPNVVCLTTGSHRWAHAHPVEAGPAGLLLPPRECDPAAVPVRTWRGWVFLTADGGVQRLA
jgi:5-methylcytosine-specific restriction enzyme A